MIEGLLLLLIIVSLRYKIKKKYKIKRYHSLNLHFVSAY